MKNNVSNKSNHQSTNPKDWLIESEKNYQNKDAVKLVLTNNQEHALFIFDPLQKNIEKFNGKEWVKLNLPYCPCAGCPAPPETQFVPAKQKFIFFWDKKLDNCNNGKKTIQDSKSGKYRVLINYGEAEAVREFKKLYIEFEM